MLSSGSQNKIFQLINKKREKLSLNLADFSLFVSLLKNNAIAKDELVLFLSLCDQVFSLQEAKDLIEVFKNYGEKIKFENTDRCVSFQTFSVLPNNNELFYAALFNLLDVHFYVSNHYTYQFNGHSLPSLVGIGYKVAHQRTFRFDKVLQDKKILIIDNMLYLHKIMHLILEIFWRYNLFNQPLLFFSFVLISKLNQKNMLHIWSIDVGWNGFFTTLMQAKKTQVLLFELAQACGFKLILIYNNSERLLNHDYGFVLNIKKQLALLNNETTFVFLQEELIKAVCEIMYLTNWEINKSITRVRCENFLRNKEALTVINRLVSLNKITIFKFNAFRYNKYFLPKETLSVKSEKDGFLKIANYGAFNYALFALCIRDYSLSKPDYMGGISWNFSANDWVKKGDVICNIYSNHPIETEIVQNIKKCFEVINNKETSSLNYIKSVEANFNTIKVKKTE